jgi:uncharacterized membrane protein
MQYVIAYAAAAAAFFLGDMLWLGKFAKSFYRKQLGHLFAARFRAGVAGLFYAFYIVGIVIFAISPGLQAGLWELAFGYGALFGLFAYGTYDMTNLATLRRGRRRSECWIWRGDVPERGRGGRGLRCGAGLCRPPD